MTMVIIISLLVVVWSIWTTIIASFSVTIVFQQDVGGGGGGGGSVGGAGDGDDNDAVVVEGAGAVTTKTTTTSGRRQNNIKKVHATTTNMTIGVVVVDDNNTVTTTSSAATNTFTMTIGVQGTTTNTSSTNSNGNGSNNTTTTTTTTTGRLLLLGCDDMSKIQILKQISQGHHRTTYLVQIQLPPTEAAAAAAAAVAAASIDSEDGRKSQLPQTTSQTTSQPQSQTQPQPILAVAKRCHANYKVCVQQMEKESVILQLLQNQQQQQQQDQKQHREGHLHSQVPVPSLLPAVPKYYGKCFKKFKKPKRFIGRYVDDFSVGYTLLMDVGQVFLEDVESSYDEYDPAVVVNSTTELLQLDQLNYLLAYGIPQGPILLGLPYNRTDLCYLIEWARFTFSTADVSSTGRRNVPQSSSSSSSTKSSMSYLFPIDFGNAHLVNTTVVSRDHAFMLNRCISLYHLAKIRFWEDHYKDKLLLLPDMVDNIPSTFTDQTCYSEYGAQCVWNRTEAAER